MTQRVSRAVGIDHVVVDSVLQPQERLRAKISIHPGWAKSWRVLLDVWMEHNTRQERMIFGVILSKHNLGVGFVSWDEIFSGSISIKEAYAIWQDAVHTLSGKLSLYVQPYYGIGKEAEFILYSNRDFSEPPQVKCGYKSYNSKEIIRLRDLEWWFGFKG